MAYVYRHIRLDKNEPFYIGIGSSANHLRAYSEKNRNNHWRNIVNISDYEIEVLFDNLTNEDAKLKEIEFIKLYGRVDLGTGTLVNLTDGGDGCLCRIITNEVKAKIGNANRGKVHSAEHKKRLSEFHKKRLQNLDELQKHKDNLKNKKKKPFSKEHRIKISESNKKRIYTDLIRKNMSEGQKKRIANNKGVLFTKEQLIENGKKISKSSIGKKMSKSAKKKMSDNQKLPVLQYDLEYNFIKEWDGIIDASNFLGKQSTGIVRCCQGKFKKAYGFVWKYKYPEKMGRRPRKQEINELKNK